MHAGIVTQRDEIAEPCRSHRVLRLEFFGTTACGTSFDPATSEADFLAEFDESRGSRGLSRHFAFQDALADALGREVDLLEGSEGPRGLVALHRCGRANSRSSVDTAGLEA